MSDGKALTIFEPNDHQRAVLSAFQESDYGCTVVGACQAAGITKQAYYLWFDNPAFGEWWEEQSNRFFRRQLARVQHATMVSAIEADAPGSPQAQKLFFERFDRDYCPASRNHAELSGPAGGAIPIQIVMFGTPPVPDDETNGDAAAGI